jgi:hypothetical protein
MSETALLPLLNPCRKDPVALPLPTPRALGLGRLLAELEIGESGIIQRHAAGDLYKTGLALGRRFTCRRIDAETSRVWRLA